MHEKNINDEVHVHHKCTKNPRRHWWTADAGMDQQTAKLFNSLMIIVVILIVRLLLSVIVNNVSMANTFKK
jgi:hypothetical protein